MATKLTLQQIRRYAAEAGFTGEALDTIVAIAMAESGGKPDAIYVNKNQSVDRGIVQINNRAWPNISDECAFNPACAFKQAYLISKGGTNFRPWMAFVHGSYRQFLPESSPIKQIPYEELDMQLAQNYNAKSEGTYGKYTGEIKRILHTEYDWRTPGFASAVFNWQKQNGFVGKWVDGKLGPETFGRMIELDPKLAQMVNPKVAMLKLFFLKQEAYDEKINNRLRTLKKIFSK